VPRTDTFIEKESSINEQIDRMRHSATRALLERDDVIIVASVSCIYGIGSVETYTAMTFQLRSASASTSASCWPTWWRCSTSATTGLPARHVPGARRHDRAVPGPPGGPRLAASRCSATRSRRSPSSTRSPAEVRRPEERQDLRQLALRHAQADAEPGVKSIKEELKQRLEELNAAGRCWKRSGWSSAPVRSRDAEATGSCAGIENYSRYLTGRAPGEPPPTLFEYCPTTPRVHRREPRHHPADRRHVPRRLPPQGDAGRVRLPPAVLPSTTGRCASRSGTRCARRPSHVSATPGAWEMEQTGGVFAEQVIRPTGLIDPPVEIRPAPPRSTTCSASPRGGRQGLPHAGHRAHQAHGRGPDRISARTGHARALHALRHRHAGAHRDHPRPAAGRVRRAGRHQPAARGARHPRMRAGRHSRRRQGGLPALRDLADPDHRPRRAQRRRQGHPLCRQGHRLDGARHGRDRAPPRQAAGLQRGARHHAGSVKRTSPTFSTRSTSATTCG
jgi:hypothetical protein